MGKLVNIEGIELEQCVLDNDELDGPIVREVLGMYEDNSEYILSDPLEDDMDYITTTPEDVQFINEYIESELDKQPDNVEEDIHIQDLLEQESEVFPSCVGFIQWVQHSEFADAIPQYEDYVREYKKELREWYFNKHPQYARNSNGDVAFYNGQPVTNNDLELGDKVMDMYSNSIDNDKDYESDNN
jgi:hypothetical protein